MDRLAAGHHAVSDAAPPVRLDASPSRVGAPDLQPRAIPHLGGLAGAWKSAVPPRTGARPGGTLVPRRGDTVRG